MAMTALQKNRSVRREAMREQLSAHGHFEQMLIALEKMTELAEGEIIDQTSRDRFSMLSALADRHWKVVEKYLPSLPADATTAPSNGVSQLQRAVMALGMRRDTPAIDERARTEHDGVARIHEAGYRR